MTAAVAGRRHGHRRGRRGTLLAAALAPDASRVFWTDALWNTDRVGELAFVSNQSLRGVVARLDPASEHPGLAGAGARHPGASGAGGAGPPPRR